MTKKERIRKFGEVFTPEWVAEMMLDDLERENPDEDVFRVGSVMGDITGCGEGVFLTGIMRRKLKRCQSQEDILTALRNLYGIDIQEDNVQKARKAVLALVSPLLDPERMREAERITEANIVAGNFLEKKLNTGQRIPWLEDVP